MMGILSDLETLISDANDTLGDLNGLVEQLQEQYPPGWCYLFDFTDNDGSWQPYPNPYTGHISSWDSSGWNGYYQPQGGDDCVVDIYREFSSITLTRIEVTVVSNGNCSPYGCVFSIDDHNGNLVSESPTHNGQHVYTWTGSRTTDYIKVSEYVSGTQPGKITSIEIQGQGSNPFGSDNCP